MISLLVNIDVPDLDAAVDFYRRAVGLQLGRRLFDETVAEMLGASAPIYLLAKPTGSTASATTAAQTRLSPPLDAGTLRCDGRGHQRRGARGEGGGRETRGSDRLRRMGQHGQNERPREANHGSHGFHWPCRERRSTSNASIVSPPAASARRKSAS